MKTSKVWIDSHGHWASSGKVAVDEVRRTYQEARQIGVGGFVQGGVEPLEWQRQVELAQAESGVAKVFGLHPWWVAGHTDVECESALDELARALPQALALGETGLDFGRRGPPETRSRQVDLFRAQLELAQFRRLPVVLHVVRAHNESLRLIDLHEDVRGFVHGFTGSPEEARAWTQRSWGISVGPRSLRAGASHDQAIREIPQELILVESDDEPPLAILQVAEKIARLRGVTKEQILDMSAQNLRRLLNWDV